MGGNTGIFVHNDVNLYAGGLGTVGAGTRPNLCDIIEFSCDMRNLRFLFKEKQLIFADFVNLVMQYFSFKIFFCK